MSKGLMNNGLTTSEEEYYFTKGYQQGRAEAERGFQNSDYWNDYLAKVIADAKADAIEECIDILNNSIPLVDNTDIIFGFKCAVERLEQLKEQK